jgi:hypothetical protein
LFTIFKKQLRSLCGKTKDNSLKFSNNLVYKIYFLCNKSIKNVWGNSQSFYKKQSEWSYIYGIKVNKLKNSTKFKGWYEKIIV